MYIFFHLKPKTTKASKMSEIQHFSSDFRRLFTQPCIKNGTLETFGFWMVGFRTFTVHTTRALVEKLTKPRNLCNSS